MLCTWLGEGGVRGTFSGGIVEPDSGVAGVGETFELREVATGPTGGGSFVLALADPGRTIGLESEILGLSAYRLYSGTQLLTCALPFQLSTQF